MDLSVDDGQNFQRMSRCRVLRNLDAVRGVRESHSDFRSNRRDMLDEDVESDDRGELRLTEVVSANVDLDEVIHCHLVLSVGLWMAYLVFAVDFFLKVVCDLDDAGVRVDLEVFGCFSSADDFVSYLYGY